PAVTDGTVYLLDYDTDKRHDAMRALSLETGEEIWRRSYYVKVINNHGKSRTVPAVTEEYIVSLGPRCHVVCLDRATGDFRWGLDLVEDYGTKVPDWHAAQCPLILNGVAILAPAGPDTLLMGVECESGDVLWKTPNEPGWLMSHSSVMPMTLLGKKMYVYSAEGGLVGVSAEEGDTGELLWEFAWTALVVAPSPVKVANDQIFMSTGRGAGNVLLQLSESDGIYAVNSLYEKAPDEGLSSIQQTPIFANDRLYCILPKGGGAAEKQFVAYDVEGNFVWSSGQDKRLGKYGNGPFLLADDKFYILHDDGILRMIDATVDEYVELGEAHLLHGGHDAWAPLTLVGSRMLLRNSRTLICIDLGAA
ncbi:MAG: PQQ-binding-like beta-propeller repeat protein, partial [Candidatus Hydrogenedentes bacterium]|nr:PQQ-binding-like beta-propeller repeat protein [Candidatus Hydrogenedentota bacterium]